MEHLVNDLFRCDYSNLQTVILDILSRLKSQEAKTASLENTVREKDAVIERLSNEVSDGLQIINNNNTKYIDFNLRLNAIEDAVNVHTDEITSLRSNMKDMLQRLDRLDLGGGEGGLSSSEIKDRLVNLECNMAKLDNVDDRLNILMKTKMDKSEHEAEISELENSISNLQQQLTRNNTMVRDQQGTLSRINGLVEEGEVDLAVGKGKGRVSAQELSLYVERAAYDADLAALNDVDSGHASEIRKLWSAIKKLKSACDELEEAGTVRDSQISELRTAIGALGKLVNALTENMNGLVDKRDLQLLRDDMLRQLKDTANTLREHTRSELKRFESDLMLFLEEREKSKDNTETAIGKVYFRCLTCNQPTASQHGPHSKHYQHTSQMHAPPYGAPALGAPTGTLPRLGAGMVIEKGNDVTVHGADGQVYKGREDAVVHFTSSGEPDAGNSRNNAQFRVMYAGEQAGAPSRRLTSRGSNGTARGVSAGGASYNRPQSARLPVGYEEAGLVRHDTASPAPSTHVLAKQSQLMQQFDGNSAQPMALAEEKSMSMQNPLASSSKASAKTIKRPATTAGAFR